MRTVLMLAAVAAGLPLAGAGAAAASPCGDRIAALEARLDEEAEAAISASTGGKGVAAAREGQAVQAENRDAPAEAPVVPFQDEAREERATERAAEAGGGGDRVMQAKASLNRARAMDGEGNASACEEALAEAEAQIEAR